MATAKTYPEITLNIMTIILDIFHLLKCAISTNYCMIVGDDKIDTLNNNNLTNIAIKIDLRTHVMNL